MTTRRTALGAILGGVTTGPEVVKAAIEEGISALSQLPMSALEVAAKQSGFSVEMITKWQRRAAGDVSDDDLAYNTRPDYDRDLKALKSVSPVVRRMWAKDRRVAEERERLIQHAIKRLFELKLR